MLISMKRIAAFGVLGTIMGCGYSGSDIGPHLNLVKGRVAFTDNRKSIDSVNSAILEFHPKDGDSADQKVWGSLMEGGFFVVTEEAGEKTLGAPEGDYVVTITPPANQKQSIPAKYSDPKTSDLTAHVEPGADVYLDFQLKP